METWPLLAARGRWSGHCAEPLCAGCGRWPERPGGSVKWRERIRGVYTCYALYKSTYLLFYKTSVPRPRPRQDQDIKYQDIRLTLRHQTPRPWPRHQASRSRPRPRHQMKITLFIWSENSYRKSDMVDLSRQSSKQEKSKTVRLSVGYISYTKLWARYWQLKC